MNRICFVYFGKYIIQLDICRCLFSKSCSFSYNTCAHVLINLLKPANEVCEGYVFTPVCQSFCSPGGVSRPRPRGEVGGLPGGVSRPTPEGGGGVQAHAQGGPGPGLRGVYPSMH